MTLQSAETHRRFKALADGWRVAASRYPGPVPSYPITMDDATAQTLHRCADAVLAVLVWDKEHAMSGRTVGERKGLSKLKSAWAHVNEKKRHDADKLEVMIPEPVWADLEAAIEPLTKDDKDGE